MNRGLSVGIFLQNASARVCLMRRSMLGRRTRTKKFTAHSKIGLWGSDADALGPLFADIAKKIPSDALRPDCPVNISLPDPLVTEEQFVFRDFPVSQKEAEALVSWRFGRDHQREMDGLICSHQVLEAGDPDTVVLVRAMEAKQVTQVLQASWAAGLFVNRLDGWVGYLPTVDGATVWSNGEWWSLICQADETTNNLFRSDWCGDAGEDTEKISRLTTAFALNSKREQLPVSVSVTGELGKSISKRLGGQELFQVTAGPGALDTEATLAECR